ncbi:hypothetical protein, partial [Secundilactobacillus similis]|uniref:hypothetical protein n=1 Tax=Secundilactobacillus similis TaxID=414682 RepID=UPI001CDA6054
DKQPTPKSHPTLTLDTSDSKKMERMMSTSVFLRGDAKWQQKRFKSLIYQRFEPQLSPARGFDYLTFTPYNRRHTGILAIR